MTHTESTADTMDWRRSARVEEAPLQGELMLFDPSNSKFFVLNRTMAFLWRHCDGTKPLTAIVEELTREFSDVEPARAEAELRSALAELADLGLLIRS